MEEPGRACFKQEVTTTSNVNCSSRPHCKSHTSRRKKRRHWPCCTGITTSKTDWFNYPRMYSECVWTGKMEGCFIVVSVRQTLRTGEGNPHLCKQAIFNYTFSRCDIPMISVSRSSPLSINRCTQLQFIYVLHITCPISSPLRLSIQKLFLASGLRVNVSKYSFVCRSSDMESSWHSHLKSY